MLSAVGCSYTYTFCCIPLIKYKERSPVKIVDEMEDCYNNHNIREIDFFDTVFTLNKKRILELCKEIKKRNLHITWSCRSRIDNVDNTLLKEMANAGCSRIYYGIESTDKNIQPKIKKKMRYKKIKDTIHLTKKHNIMALGFFMIGNPGETKKSILKNMDFAKKLNLNYIQYSRTIAKPGSPLNEELTNITGKDYWKEYILGNVKDERISNPWCELSDDEIEKYTQKAYLDFYLRPKYVLRSLLNIRSLHELGEGCQGHG